MKKILIFIIIIFGTGYIKAQTYISPMIGYEFLNMNTENDVISGIQVIENKFGIQNAVIGLKLKQNISKKINISVLSCFSKRYTDASTIGIVPYDGFTFNHFQNGLQLNYNLQNYFCSVGGNYNVIKELTLTIDKKVGNGHPMIKTLNEKGIRFAFGRTYKKINLEAYFYKGWDSYNDKEHIFLKPIESIGLLLSYEIKVFNGFKKKNKAACPTF